MPNVAKLLRLRNFANGRACKRNLVYGDRLVDKTILRIEFVPGQRRPAPGCSPVANWLVSAPPS